MSRKPAPGSIQVRVIKEGRAEGRVLASSTPLSFYGGLDLETATVIEAGHPLVGQRITGTMLYFPTGKGSTVGSYALYRLARAGLAPRALIMERCEPIVATGAILASIPCVDGVAVGRLETGDRVRLDGARLEILPDDEDRA